jgi:Electron transfer DM13
MEFLGELERLFATSLYPLRVPIAIGLAVVFVMGVVVARRRGWFAAARRHPGRTTLLVVALLAVGLPVGWYLGSPLFIRTSLVEPGPSAPAPGATTPVPGTESPAAGGVRTGEFIGADEFHFGSGTASLVETSPGAWTLRFEDFSVRNGPDLFVYVSPDPAGYTTEATELGTLKATDGSFNYDLPAEIDVEAIRSVVIWCKAFAVTFAVAPLG